MQGLSPRNLKYMRSFAAAWPDPEIVQRVIAQLPWRQNIALLDKLGDPTTRLWYAQQAVHHGWSQPILCLQIETRLHERQGKAQDEARRSGQYVSVDEVLAGLDRTLARTRKAAARK